ncbi:nicotinate-nucleotide--dimethylbenzimidazole phosphoribosyltransferase [Streptomyces sp. GSL17-111]|uniref:nicotinate-nucleotide--dimethylbenzimidazole phosphoribosyltransferase n=1 Tax=Streptomyces sp. GSL17-111 TaxID=3121596 RepID=UPI0030F4473A
MTDTGQVPAEGLPENAGAQPEQAHTPASGTYTFADPAAGGAVGDEDDQLLMPGAVGAWNESVHSTPAQPVPSAAHLPGPHDTAGGGTGYQEYAPAPEYAHGPEYAPPPEYAQGPGHTGGPVGGVPRRPLHLGPPVPEQSGAVRSLADRGPTPSAAAPGPAPAAEYAAPPAPEYDAPGHPDAGQVAGAPAEGGYAPAVEQPAPGFEQQHVATPVQPGAWSVPADQAPGGQPQPQPDAEAVGPYPQAPPPGLDPAAEAHPGGEAYVGPQAEHGPQPPEQVAQPEPQAEAPAPEPSAEPEPVAQPVASVEAPEVLTEAAGPEPAPIVEQPQEQAVSAEEPAAEPAAVEPAPAEHPQGPGHPDATAEVQEAVEAPLADVPQEQPAAPEAVVAPEGVPTPGTEAAPADTPGGPTAPQPEPAAQPEPIVAETAHEAPEAPEAPDAVPPAPGDVPADGAEAAAPVPDAEAAVLPDTGAEAAPEAAPAAAPPQPEPPRTPPAPGYPDAEREALHKVMRERRDIRNGFRSDPIPHEVLLRVLEAAHTAPSVGHSQPWDFVIIRSEETRRAMHELAVRQREAYAKSLPRARAKQFKELKIEAILDTPVNIVVTADPTRGGRHTLGRHTQPQMAPYSSALAVENLWLAARAEGLGVGWVSFFDEREMVTALGLPEHLEVVAYLCIGYVDAFPDEPELAQAGWSKRRPLSWVVHEEAYGRRVLPGGAPSDLLAETLAGIRPLDAKALGEAWERQKRMTKPSGALGMLEIISAQLSGLARKCPPPVPEPAAVAVFAGDHGVHAQGVTAWPQEVTAQMVANFLGGGAVCNAFANQVGAEVCVVDVGVAAELPATPGLLPRKVRPGTADISVGPAMERAEAVRAIEVGIETARDLVTAGNRALLTGEMGIANTTVSAALISAFTGTDPAEVTGRGTGINDEMHSHKIDVVRRALELHRPDPGDPIGVLAALGGLEHAALVGLILGGASLRTPVILDGVSAGAAALVARAIAPEALAACVAGHRGAEPGHVVALTKLGLRPLVDLDLRLGEGTGALLALPVVQSAARAMHEVATFDAAGVTEKG